MCGIAGIVAPNAAQMLPALEKMVAALHHRGPDSNGIAAFSQCLLGNTRLSIIDVQGGKQPIASGLSDTVLTFNGEIYGYQQIRNRYSNWYPFSTHTDSEVVLALYEEKGYRFIQHLPGMFALAIWNNDKQELLLARDRFGEKPLYYARPDAQTLLFASEIKALLASGFIKPVLDTTQVAFYLRHGYVLPGKSIYQNIQAVPSAHILLYANGSITLEKYWNPPAVNHDIAEPEAAPVFAALLTQAVEKQLVADVPVGTFLSGGLDSSTITAIAAQQHPHIKTFSFGFSGGVESELPFARLVAHQYQTQHIEMIDDDIDVAGLLWQMQQIYDEPFADSSNIPTWLISKLASQHVKVALSGDGADELLGGYFYWSRYLFPELQRTAPPTPQPIKRFWLQDALRRLQQWYRQMGLLQQETTNTNQPPATAARRYYGFRNYFSDRELQQLGLPNDIEKFTDYTKYNTNTPHDALLMDVDGYLCGDILVKTDRAAMANSLELRSPFLDVELAEFCLSLPLRYKVNPDTEKLILRNTFSKQLPPQITRRNKQGFGAPIHVWLQQPAVQELIQTFLLQKNSKIYSVLNFEAVQPYIALQNQQTWSFLTLALWMETHSFTL